MKKIITPISLHHTGFTLLETLFAVIIFSFALVSLMSIAAKGVIAASSAKEQLVAQYLAEELVEVARNTRDSNYLAKFGGAPDTDWLAGLDCTMNTPCDISYVGTDPFAILEPCGGRTCGILYNVDGHYSQDTEMGDPTTFSRSLVVTPSLTHPQATLTATVTWKHKNVDRQYVLETALTNWQP